MKSIHERPESDLAWEGDTVKGSTKPKLLTHVEQTSLYTRADLLPSGTADAVHATLKRTPLSGTITYDRGSEFALYGRVWGGRPRALCMEEGVAFQVRIQHHILTTFLIIVLSKIVL